MNEQNRSVKVPAVYRRQEQRHQPSTLINGYSSPFAKTNYFQQVIFLLDRSGSMADEGKAQAADRAACAAVEVLGQPQNQNAFEVAIVHYDDQLELAVPIRKATSIVGNVPPLTPRGMTNINDALEYGRALLAEPQLESCGTYLRSIVVMMTDGQSNDGPSPEGAAQLLTQLADLVCVPFGSDADHALLRRLATSPDHCLAVTDGQQLRHFFAALSTTVSQSRRAGMDATRSIAALTRSLRAS